MVAANSPAGRDFDERIAPLLARHCLDCHNPTDKKGGLDLTRCRGGRRRRRQRCRRSRRESRPRVCCSERIDSDEMPPEASAADREEKRLLHEWIAAGAAWGTTPIDRFRYSSENRAGFDWWALRPIVAPPLPAVRQADWPIGAIDRWILARLEARAAQSRAAGRSADADPPRDVRSDRFAADAGRSRRPLSRRFAARPTSGWSIGCWPRRTTANVGAGIGSTWSAFPRVKASSATSTIPARGSIAIG